MPRRHRKITQGLVNNFNTSPCVRCGREPRLMFDRVDGTTRCPKCRLVFKGTHVAEPGRRSVDSGRVQE